MRFELDRLPYDFDSLEPHVSAETLKIHRNRHHQGYVETLNALIEGTALDGCDLVDIILRSAQSPETQDILNNAGQVWNHIFYFNSMTPRGGGVRGGALGEAIDRDFGGWPDFRSAFKAKAEARFGSGYVWLVLDRERLDVCDTLNARPPFIDGKSPILGLDVWEHAYYLDYLNKRGSYVDAFLNHLANWEFAAKQYEGARAGEPIHACERERIKSSILVG